MLWQPNLSSSAIIAPIIKQTPSPVRQHRDTGHHPLTPPPILLDTFVICIELMGMLSVPSTANILWSCPIAKEYINTGRVNVKQ
jgi:hypothetical protein